MELRGQAARIISSISLLSILVLTGCSSSDSTPPDTTPNTLEFGIQTDVQKGEVVESAALTVQDIDQPVDVTISGAEYRIGSGAYTSAPGKVDEGDTIQVRITAPDAFSTDGLAVLTVGEGRATFTVTTEAQDLEPDSFEFTPTVGKVGPGSELSDTVVINGINDTAPVSIENGTYRIGTAGEFTDQPGTVSDGQSITVKVMAPSGFSTTATATLTVGSVSKDFSITTIDQDIIPEEFSFDAQTDVALSTAVNSNTVTIEGMNDAASIKVEGGLYLIGEDGDFTAEEGVISSGQKLTLQVVSSTAFSTEAQVTVTIGGDGGVSQVFSVTTLPQDIEPETYSLGAKSGVALGAMVTSDPVTITGINDAAPVSIVGGAYRIGDTGEFTSEPGTIGAGETVTVRVTSAGIFSENTTATLSVGGVESVFTVTTVAQDLEPEAFSFAAQVDVARSTPITSNSTTIEGITGQVPITISGGSYKIGEQGEFTTEVGVIENGQTLSIQLTSAAAFSTDAVATVTIGAVSSTFTVTTLARDISPDGFSFDAQNMVERSTEITSNTVVITGINDAAPISIAGGLYRVGDSGAFTDQPGVINAGETLTLQVTSSSEFDTAVTASVTVGDELPLLQAFTVSTLLRDIVPEDFFFDQVVDIERNTAVESATVTIEGINDAAPISIENGRYKIGNGAFTSEPGTVSNGDEVVVEVTTEDQFSAPYIATLNVGGPGGKSSTFTAMTVSRDIVPDEIVFTPVVNALPNTRYVSNEITISGLNDETLLGIQRGEYSLNGAPFVPGAAEGEATNHFAIKNGDKVVLALTSAPDVEEQKTVRFTVGDDEIYTSSEFVVTNRSELEPPTAEIVFPPPRSLAARQSLIVRGRSSDNDTVASVTVNGIPAISDDGFLNWQATVTVENPQNTIEVIATDAADNQSDPVFVSVLTTTDLSTFNFPETAEQDRVFDLNLSRGVADMLFVEREGGAFLYFLSSLEGNIFKVDLETGERTVLFQGSSSFERFVAAMEGLVDFEGPVFPPSLTYDDEDDVFYVTDIGQFEIYRVDAKTGALDEIKLVPEDFLSVYNYHTFISRNALGEKTLLIFNTEGIYELNLITLEVTLLLNENTTEGNVRFGVYPKPARLSESKFIVPDSDQLTSSDIKFVEADLSAGTIKSLESFQNVIPEAMLLLENSQLLVSIENRPIIGEANALIRYDVSDLNNVMPEVVSRRNHGWGGKLLEPFVIDGKAGAEFVYMRGVDTAVYALDVVTGERVIIQNLVGAPSE